MAQKAFLINRYERKYIVDEHKALAIRDMVRCHFDPDEYMPPMDSEGYPVYSLYLDSPRLVLYQATAQGMMNRFKLRVRYYDDLDSSPVFFEVKQRLNQTVRKRRTAVKRPSLARLLGGHTPDPDDLSTELVDLRGGRTSFRLIVNTGVVRQLRTLASGGRIEATDRVNNPKHAWIRERSPFQPSPAGEDALPKERR